jgi:hypothetical protein
MQEASWHGDERNNPLLPTSMRESRFSMAYSHPYSFKETDDLEALMNIDALLHTEHQLDQ